MKMTLHTTKSLASFLLLEGTPLVVFFTVFAQTQNFSSAVLGLIISTIISTIFSFIIYKRLPYFTLVAASTTSIAGIFTYAYDSPSVLILRDTLYYSSFGAVLFVMQHKGRFLLKKMFESIFAISDTGWKELCKRWGIFLICAGIANTVIGFSLPIAYWVVYKSFLIVIFLLFGTYQLTLTKKYALKNATTLGLRR
jgi:intracellular septation protein